jgi:hypothetical protein
MPLEAHIQRDIEDAVRAKVGVYLRDVVPPGQPVGLEAAGYFGYYSGATIYDYPGLTSRAALSAVRSLPAGERDVAGMLSILRPPWIVVRPDEYADMVSRHPAIAARYALCRRFENGSGETIGWGGLVKETIDRAFEVRHLDGCPPGAALDTRTGIVPAIE